MKMVTFPGTPQEEIYETPILNALGGRGCHEVRLTHQDFEDLLTMWPAKVGMVDKLIGFLSTKFYPELP